MYNAHLLYILHRIQLQNKNIQTMKKIHIILILALQAKDIEMRLAARTAQQGQGEP